MKNIKKVILIILIMSICSLLIGQTAVLAQNESLKLGVYNLSGERECVVNVILSELRIKDENGGYWLERSETAKDFDVTEEIMTIAEEHENFIYMDMKTDNSENPYPEIEPTSVSVMLPQATGNVRELIGKDYRLYYAPDGNSEYEDVSDKITDTSQSRPQFALEKLGIYILCFNPKAYNVTFYLEEPIYEDGNWINQDCIYEQIEDLEYRDTIEFPEIPQKDGYIFTGWKARHFSGGSYGNPFKYTLPQPIRVGAHKEFFATWCLEDEYEPINIEISSSEPITKGKENAKKITLKTNYGVFVKDDDFPTEWRTAYESETDEQVKADILSEWKSKWNIVGADDLIIETATRVDDKTVELVLSGNSSDKYTASDIYIEFDSSLLLSEPYENDGELLYPPDTKIKMDKDGVRAKMYRSDNAVTLSKQNRPSSGGGGTTRCTVTFDSNGGSVIAKQTINRNAAVKEPEAPQKEDYNFIGWFTDKELTKEYDFVAKVTKSITLYAKWEEIDISKNQIILTIGEKSANVFGETVINDVAPQIVNDFTMLPIRFVAENLGADVEWIDTAPGIVKITKEDIEIVIYIGEDYALVNNERVMLDTPAFIENDRTFTPIRFVYEQMGADVVWNEESKSIIITIK